MEILEKTRSYMTENQKCKDILESKDIVKLKNILLTPICKRYYNHIESNSDKVQKFVKEYKKNSTLRVYKIKSVRGKYKYILLDSNSKFYAYKEVLKLDRVEVKYIPIKDMTENEILEIISIILSRKERGLLVDQLIKLKENNFNIVPSIESANTQTTNKNVIFNTNSEVMVDINVIRIPNFILNEINQLTPNHKKVEKTIYNYKITKKIEPFKVYKNIPIEKLYLYYTYVYVFGFKKVAIIPVNEDELNEKQKKIIQNNSI